MFVYYVLHAWIVQNHFINESLERNEMLRAIGTKYFDTNFISVFHSTADPKGSNYGLLNAIKIFNDMSLWTLQIYNREVKADPLKDVKPEVMLLLFEGVHDEQAVFGRLKEFRNNYAWSARSKIVIIAEGDENSFMMYMSSVWRVWRAIYVVFWSLNGNRFYTWEPYKKNECDVLRTIKQSSLDELFRPVDLRNLNGCPLKATAAFVPPFVLRINNHTRMYDTGVECKVMEIIAQSLNSDLRYVELPSTENVWVWKSKDGKVTGAMGMLARQEIEVAYSSISLNYERFQLAEPLTSHIQDDISWFVPTPTAGNPIHSLYKIFGFTTWIMIYAIMILITIIMYYQERNVSLFECIMNILVAFLNMPTTSNSKFLLMLLYFGAVHLATAYQAMLLVSLVKDTTEKPIETLQEAVEADLFAFLPPSMRIYFNVTEHHLWNQILRPGHYLLSNELVHHIQDIVANKSAIGLYPKSTTMYAVNRLFPDGNYGPKVLILSERLASLTLAFYVPKGHPLKPVLDFKMNQVISGGFTHFWTDRYLSKAYWTKNKEFLTDGPRKPLSIMNLKSIFYVYIVCNALGILIFIFEIGYYSYSQRKRNRVT